jgi:hypothetical protein
MPDVKAGSTITQAFQGEQVYNFELKDKWGPNSTDPNQAKNITLIGKPIWRFYIEEYWRRIYIQPWEDSIANNKLTENIDIKKIADYISTDKCLVKESLFSRSENSYTFDGKTFNFNEEDRINYLSKSYFILSTSQLTEKLTCDYKLAEVTGIYNQLINNDITYRYYVSGNEKRYFTKNSILDFDDNGKHYYLPINPSYTINAIYTQTGEDNDYLKKGIKYDASKPEHSFGPFREGNQFYFFNTVVNRTMPIEYWKNVYKTKRDYYVKDGEPEETSGGQTWSFDAGPIIFEWVLDTHYCLDTYYSYDSSWGYYRMRNNVVYREPIHNYSYSQVGHNAKRLKQHSPRNSVYNEPSKQTLKYNEILYPVRGEDTDIYSGFEENG